MSKINVQLGDRVQLLPYKHKGKQGLVKHLGEIEGKAQGNWVGIELDEPQGDCNGDYEGNQIFACKDGHGIFLRPTAVKLVGGDRVNLSSIAGLDDEPSLLSGVENIGQLLGPTSARGEGKGDINVIDTNFNLDPIADGSKAPGEDEKTQEKPAASQPAEAAGGGGQGGRVKGWKERLAKLREQKELEKKQIEESRAERSQFSSSRPQEEADPSLAQLKDVFAPAKGLERDEKGKIAVDKEQVEEKKKEPVFEKAAENLVKAELNKQAGKASVISSSASLQALQLPSAPQRSTPVKAPRVSLMDRQKTLTSAVKPDGEAKGDAKVDAKAAAAPRGLQAPSRVARLQPPSGNMSTTEQKRQSLLEKQKAVNAKMAEKKQTGTARAGGAAASRWAGVRSKVGTAASAGKTDEEKKATLASRRAAAHGAVASRLNTGRASVRPKPDGASGENAEPTSGAATSRATAPRIGATAALARGRNTSASRDKDLTGLNRTTRATSRGSSKDKGQEMQFGKTRERSSSGNRMNLAFGKKEAADTVKLDPSMTTIKKKELEDLKADVEAKKEEIFNITIKMKKVQNESEQMGRDHKDQLEEQANELSEQHKKVHEELVLKHNDERNRLIQESNRSNDSKFNDLKAQFDEISKERDGLEERLKQTTEDMAAQKATELANLQAENEQKFEAMKNDLTKQIEEKTKTLEESNEKAMKLVEKIQSSKARVEELEETVQSHKMDIETLQLQVEEVTDEKDKLMDEITENNKLTEDDVLNSLSSDELKSQNRKLRQAVTSLCNKFEDEKVKMQKQIEDEEGKKKIIAQYEKKLQDMDVLLEELDQKEAELAEVKMENEACLEYETMVEEMAQEILKGEEEAEELEKKIKQLEDILNIQEGYTENLEQLNQELNEELEENKAEMNAMENQKVEDEELMIDLEDQNQNYREKVQQQTKVIKELTTQIEQLSDNSSEKTKMSSLVEKQNLLVRQLRENEIKDIDQKLTKIDYHWSNLLKSKVIEGIIPPRLNEKVHFDSLDKIKVLNQSMHRAMLMIRYICEKQMPNVETMYGADDEQEFERKIQFVRMMIILSEQAVMFVNIAQRILICLNNMSVEQYIKATTSLMAWNKLEKVGDEMGHIIDKLKDENISLKFDTTVLEGFIKQVSELHFKIEKMFIDKSPEELAQDKPSDKEDDKSKYQLTAAQLERQKLTQNCHKLDVRHQAMRMCIAVVGLKVLIGQIISGGGAKNSNFMKKATLIYTRLIDIVFKLDHIDAEDIGKEYLNMQELVIDKRLNEKYEKIKIIWSDFADPEQIQSIDWNSILDAISRDISQLHNDYKFKRLIKSIENSYQDKDRQNIANIDEIFFIDRFKNDQSPWMEISKAIRSDIQNFEALKDKIDQLNAKNRENTKVNLQQDKTIKTLKVTNNSLESRLAQAQTKIEQLNQVKTENEIFVKKQENQQKQIEQMKKTVEGKDKIIDDIQKKYADLEDKAAKGQLAMEQQQQQDGDSHANKLAQYRKARGQNQPSRQSRTSAFFQDLAKTAWLGGRQSDSSKTPMNVGNRGGGLANLNSAEVQKHLYQVEENYMDIINQLQHDRMKLRGQKATEKLNMLKKSDGALNEFIKNQNQKHDIQLKLTREDQNQLEKTIETVDKLRTKVKLQMASVKVVDLKKKREDLEKAKQEEKQAKTSAFMRNKKLNQKIDSNFDQPHCVRTNMNINYMIIQAREQVNEAIQKLMTKDSKLSHLHIDKLSKHIEQENYAAQRAQASTDEDSISDEDDDMNDDIDPNDPNAAQKILEKKKKRAETKVRPIVNKVQIGQIEFTSKRNENQAHIQSARGDAVKKNVVFTVKSLRALQNNIGVFSV